jgi:ABC-type branched-subunit amino acid transport system substrate-binding protein
VPSGNVAVYDPLKGWINVQTRPQERLDTIRWREATAVPAPITADASRLPAPLTDRGVVPVIPGVPSTNADLASPVNRPGQFNNLSTYHVAILLPFMSGGLNTSVANNSVSEWALQYYGGIKMALSSLEQEGVRLNVNVLDTKSDTNEVYRLLRQPEIQNAHLLMGPYRRDNIRIVAEYAKRSNKPMVSPYSAVGNLTQNNPNYIQLNPSLESHCRALLNHALSEFRPEEIVIVTRNVVGEQSCLEFLRKAYEPKRAMGNPAIPEYFLPTEAYSGLNLRPYLQNKAQAAIIVPSWADETYIFHLLRSVRAAKANGQKVVVYGMPQWTEFEHMEFELYEQCQVRISQVAYIDDQSPEVLAFKKEFYARYATLPKPEAYAGYDQMIYFGRLLANFGPKVSDNLERNQGKGLHTSFQFSRVVNNAPFGAEQYAPTQRYENRFVHILEFAGYQFKPLPAVQR